LSEQKKLVFGSIWYGVSLCVTTADKIIFGKGTKLQIQTSK